MLCTSAQGVRDIRERIKGGKIGAPWTHRQDHDVLVWTDLCDAARRLGLEVRQETLPDEIRVQGGVVRIGDRKLFLVEARLSQARKNQLLLETLCTCGIHGIYLPPYLRELLDSKNGKLPRPHAQERE